jgi:4-diphosphocytidyl-2C-methyl-D-erythritol kinase
VHTGDAYAWLAEARASSRCPFPEATVLDADALQRWQQLAAVAVNDFEPVVAARHPDILTMLSQLRAIGCAPALLSGSGSVVFGVRPGGAAVGLLPESPNATVLLTRTATRVEPVSPLH